MTFKNFQLVQSNVLEVIHLKKLYHVFDAVFLNAVLVNVLVTVFELIYHYLLFSMYNFVLFNLF